MVGDRALVVDMTFVTNVEQGRGLLVQWCAAGAAFVAKSKLSRELVEAVTKYMAQRLIERERAVADNGTPIIADLRREFYTEKSCAPHCTVSCVHQVSIFDAWRAPQHPQAVSSDSLVQIE